MTKVNDIPSKYRNTQPQMEILFKEISERILQAKSHIFREADKTIIMLNWSIGNIINNKIFTTGKADYGKTVVEQLSKKLTERFGKGFTRDALFRMIRIAKQYTNREIIATLSQQLTWSHLIELSTIEDSLKRDFYTEMSRIERWSIRDLRRKISGMFYERTAIAKNPQDIIKQEIQVLRESNQLTADFIFRDPYTLDFIESWPNSEKQLEDAILNNIEKFLLEMGSDFAFMARQKMITIDGIDYWIDLLMYHRGLHCLVLIELKLGKFMAADKGQVELYLQWLKKNEMRSGENPPIGLIVCSEKSDSHIELLDLENSGIRVAQFLTALPPKEIFETRLLEAIEFARIRFEKNKLEAEN